ncbi:MAG TPA: TetR/AcrR family transcriptional regulator [Acidimicrobiales bacterium]|nr:TetR/AcrR family transcriptional regulator [Acidimicrobiales bacterium]
MSDRQLTTQGAERKQQLLDAAARLFADQGYAATRVVDIVDAAGVAKGLFYWYFENKEALFRELAADIRHRLRRQQAAAMDDSAPALTRLLQGAVASVRFMAENAPYFSLLQVEGRMVSDVSDVLRQGAEQHLRDVTAVIVAGQRDGTISDEDPADLQALAVVATVGQFSHFHRTERVDLSLDELCDYVARLVARMVATDEAAARASVASVCRGRRLDANVPAGASPG